jgi:hypothetical protein
VKQGNTPHLLLASMVLTSLRSAPYVHQGNILQQLERVLVQLVVLAKLRLLIELGVKSAALASMSIRQQAYVLIVRVVHMHQWL